jgi:hypothetical protein
MGHFMFYANLVDAKQGLAFVIVCYRLFHRSHKMKLAVKTAAQIPDNFMP